MTRTTNKFTNVKGRGSNEHPIVEEALAAYPS